MSYFCCPLTVPGDKKSEYRRNYDLATNHSGRMLLIAADQKIEHLNDDFFGSKIAPEDSRPEHLFKIAAASSGGLLAAHLGLIARYGQDYRQLPYLIKINGKTNLGTNETKDSSKYWWKVENIVKFKKQSGLKIVGIGYTLYLGGQFEAKMLAKVAKAFYEAHQNGLITVLWVYPRGKNIKEEDIHTIAGGAGVAACLNADFVKVKYPYSQKDKAATAKKFQEVTQAAGRTKVICVGGEKKPVKEMLENLDHQINLGQTSGLAVGRNLHQRPLEEASRLARACGAIIFKKAKASEALKIYNDQKSPTRKKNNRFLGLF
jgi:fructose-bisphosphate aldolase/6-deoxy-5-ketofructose 1-phosphate synthase